LLLSAFILALRQYYITNQKSVFATKHGLYGFSKRFYAFNVSQAIAPVIFIAAGIFAIIITSANRQTFTDDMALNKGGTGGYLFWAESALPIKKSLNTDDGKKEFGINNLEFENFEIVEALRLNGDDASCLNLNHIKSPPLVGVNTADFISRNSFSFASFLKTAGNPWSMLDAELDNDIIYGIADQTVLQWGLKMKVGDTLTFTAETGKTLNIVIGAGLKSSVFQGNLIVGENVLRKYFPSTAGYSVILFDGNNEDAEAIKELLLNRFSNYGFSVETTKDKLSSFFVVTNTYLKVFTILGILGLILGVFGLSFMLIRNYERRKKEFALLLATGFNSSKIRSYILKDQIIILISGIITGTFPALIATLPSLKNGLFSYWLVVGMVLAIFVSGAIILFLSVEKVKKTNLLSQLRKE
jgi:ABC-type antimicrobial peptide transport system permease subunit